MQNLQTNKLSLIRALVFGFLLFTIYYLLSTAAHAATLYIYPQSEEVYEGESIVAEVRLDTEGENVNTIEATTLVLGNQFEIIDFSTGGSIFPIFVQGPEILNEDLPAEDSAQAGGNVFFQAIAPGGFEGEGVVGKLLLKARGLGTGIVKVAQGSKVLLNDGEGTSVTTSFLDTQYNVVERPEGLVVVESDSHPIESEWRSGPFIRLEWETKPEAQYSYVLSRQADEVPDEVPDEPVGDIKLTTNEEGVFYFHLRECIDGECGPVSTRQILRDTSPPEPFEPVLGQDRHAYNGQKFLSFVTDDKYSGVSHFEVYEGDNRYVAKSPYVLRDQSFTGAMLVKAFDKAGNVQEATIMISGESLTYNKGMLAGIIGSVGAAFVVTFLVWKKRRNDKLQITNSK